MELEEWAQVVINQSKFNRIRITSKTKRVAPKGVMPYAKREYTANISKPVRTGEKARSLHRFNVNRPQPREYLARVQRNQKQFGKQHSRH